MRFILGFTVILVLLVGGLLVAPSFIDWDQYKDQGLAQVKTLSGYDIAIDGGFSVGFLPAPHVKASGVKVVNPAVSADPLATFDDLSVGVALAPLFQKQVQVTDVRLVKPVFDLRLDRNGKGNWISPEVDALLSKTGGGGSKSSGASQNIAFNNVEIEDGAFRFFDAAKNKTTELSAINVDVSAKSLQGPFDGNGTFKFGEQSVAFDIDAEAIDGDALPLRANVQYGPYGVTLKGVAGIKAPFDVQGETQIKASASALPISDDVMISGILSANQKAAAMKDAAVSVGAAKFTGQALVDMNPMSIKAAFEGQDVINLAQFLPAGGNQKATDPLLVLTEILPKSITLPQDFEADVALKTGGLVHQQILLKNARIKATKAGQAFNFSLKADDIPGTGPAAVDADITFASRSASKTGALVYSDPTLNFTVQANTQNTGQLAQALTGKSNLPIVSSSRIGKFYIKGNAKPGSFGLNESVVNLDDLKVLMNGSVKQSETKPVIDFTITSSVDDPYALAQSLNVKTEAWPKNLGAVRIGADLKGSIDNLSADAKVNAFDADFTVSGKLDELMSGAALDNLSVRIQHANLQSLLRNVGASAPGYAEMSKPIDARAIVKMDGQVITLSGIDAKLLGTEIKGALSYDGSSGKPSLSGNLTFGELSLQSAKGSSGGQSSSGRSSSGEKWSSAPMDTGWLHAANANLDISGDRLLYETWDIAKPSLKMVMQGGVLDIQNLKGGLFGGQVAVQSKVSSTRGEGNPLSLATQANISDVNIGQLAKALSGTDRLQGDGTVSLVMDVAGTGASQKNLVSSLNGSAKLDGNTIVLQGFDLEAVTNAVENDNRESILGALQSFNSGSTSFDTVNGEYSIQNGEVTITSMSMVGESSTITSTGGASLPKWTMNTEHTVSFNQTDKLDPFSFSIRGPIDRPVSTLANIGQDLLRGQAGKFVQEQIQDRLQGTEIGDTLQKFGILPSNDNAPETEPAAGDSASDAAQPVQEQAPAKSQEEQAQEAIEGVIRGLFQ